MSERTIRAAIAAGARTPQEIARACGAGSQCGGCWPALTELLRETREVREAREANESRCASRHGHGQEVA